MNATKNIHKLPLYAMIGSKIIHAKAHITSEMPSPDSYIAFFLTERWLEVFVLSIDCEEFCGTNQFISAPHTQNE